MGVDLKNVREILKDAGVELDDDKLGELEKSVLENYRTVAEFEQKTAKMAELRAQLDESAKALETAKQAADPAKVEELERQLAELRKADEERAAKAKAEAARKEFEGEFDKATNGRKFASPIVREALIEKAFGLASANPDITAGEALKKAIGGDEAGIWENPQQDVRKMPAGDSEHGGAPAGATVTSMEQLEGMSVDEIRAHMGEIDKMLKERR